MTMASSPAASPVTLYRSSWSLRTWLPASPCRWPFSTSSWARSFRPSWQRQYMHFGITSFFVILSVSIPSLFGVNPVIWISRRFIGPGDMCGLSPSRAPFAPPS